MVMTNITVRAQRLPAVGWRYSMPADQGRKLMIIVEDRGSRHLMLVDPSLDEPHTTVRLSDTDADVVAALLTGARFHIELSEDEALGQAPEETAIQAC
jgi:K+/H+ antiporter YhaU regulatory subunit KhtT